MFKSKFQTSHEPIDFARNESPNSVDKSGRSHIEQIPPLFQKSIENPDVAPVLSREPSVSLFLSRIGF
jgi:hypothetical protein